MERKGGRLAVGARAFRYSTASIASVLDWFCNTEEQQRFEQDITDHPDDNTAYVKAMQRLRDSLGPAFMMDAAYAGLDSLAHASFAAGRQGSNACFRSARLHRAACMYHLGLELNITLLHSFLLHA